MSMSALRSARPACASGSPDGLVAEDLLYLREQITSRLRFRVRLIKGSRPAHFIERSDSFEDLRKVGSSSCLSKDERVSLNAPASNRIG
jgi:hypothetical protein